MVERPNFDEIVDEIEKDAERERQVRALVSTPISGEDRKAILDDLDEEIFHLQFSKKNLFLLNNYISDINFLVQNNLADHFQKVFWFL